MAEATKQGYVDIMPGECVDLSMPNSKTRRGRAMRENSNCLTTSCGMYEYCGTIDAPIYRVDGGYVTIGDNKYPIQLKDGCYIRDRNLYEVMKQSTSSRRQPLVVMITTAGTVRECIFDNMYELACELADGSKKDDTFLPILYELDSRDEWTEPQMWIKANPGLGKIKQYKTLANFVERAKNSPADLPGVLCKDFNIRENESNVWLSFEQIKNPAVFDISEVYNTYAIGGCDLSATTDLTAATLLISENSEFQAATPLWKLHKFKEAIKWRILLMFSRMQSNSTQ